jgi:two-component system response regulator DegU
MNSSPITVVSVDDHPLIHQAIHSILDPLAHIDVVAEGVAGEDVLPLVENHHPNVLILDVGMPQSADNPEGGKFDLLEALRELHENHSETAVLLLTHYSSDLLIDLAVKAGVRGYLLKTDNLSLQLANAIETLHQNRVFFSQKISQIMFNKQETPDPGDLITPRQREIILTIARNPNATYAEIAEDLGISESTLKGHLNRAFKILDVTNIVACIILCMQRGYIPFSINAVGTIEFGGLEPVLTSP